MWAQTAVTVPLAAGLVPPPRFTGVGLIAAWADDAGVDHFLAHDPLAEQLADGWHVRLEPLRIFGGWSAMPGLAEITRPVDDDEPVAVLTLGRLRLRRAAAFFPTSRAAERQAVADPSVLLSTALVRPPRLIATFSVWRTAGAMRAYAYGADGAHVRASRAHHTRPFTTSRCSPASAPTTRRAHGTASARWPASATTTRRSPRTRTPGPRPSRLAVVTMYRWIVQS